VPNTALRFFFYDYFKQKSRAIKGIKYEGKFKLLIKNEASLLSGFFTMLLTYPFDLARTRVALDLAKTNEERLYNGVFDFFNKTIRSEGVSALYKGFGLSCLGFIPYMFVAFSCYDTMKEYFSLDVRLKSKTETDKLHHNIMKLTFLGIFSGGFAQFVTYPIDTIRRRVQINQIPTSKKYQGTLEIMYKMISEEGIKSFYNGLTPSIMRIAPAAAIQFCVFDLCKHFVFDIKYI